MDACQPAVSLAKGIVSGKAALRALEEYTYTLCLSKL